MPTSNFFDTVDSDFRRDGFPGSFDGSWEDFLDLEPTFAASPDQLSQPLPDPDPSVVWSQPSTSTYLPARGERYPANFAAAPPNPSTHSPFYFHDWPLQTDLESAQHYTPMFNPQDSRPTPTSHQSSVTLNAGRSSMHNGLQGCSSSVVNGSSHVPDAFRSPSNPFSPARSTVHSHYNGSPMFVDQTKPRNSAIGTTYPYQQIQPALAGVTQGSPSVHPDLVYQPVVPRLPPEKIPRRNSRGGRSTTNPPYHPIRTSSLPLQEISPKETALHACQWMRDDNTICGTQITYTTVPEHLITHGVESMTRNHRLRCRWFGCKIRRDREEMNRESIVRHVREKHLGYRRTL